MRRFTIPMHLNTRRVTRRVICGGLRGGLRGGLYAAGYEAGYAAGGMQEGWFDVGVSHAKISEWFDGSKLISKKFFGMMTRQPTTSTRDASMACI